MLCKGLAEARWLQQANVQLGPSGITLAGAQGQVWAGGNGGGQAQVLLGASEASSFAFPTWGIGTAVVVITVSLRSPSGLLRAVPLPSL